MKLTDLNVIYIKIQNFNYFIIFLESMIYKAENDNDNKREMCIIN